MSEQRTPKMTGGCQYGAVRYALFSQPERVGICHCRNCQRYTGSAFEPFVIFPTASVTFTGELKTFEHHGDSGRSVRRCFCPNCGSGVINIDPTHNVTLILAGTLDDPSLFKPTIEICCDTALTWVPNAGGASEEDRVSEENSTSEEESWTSKEGSIARKRRKPK